MTGDNFDNYDWLKDKAVRKTPFVVINTDGYYGKEEFAGLFEMEAPRAPLKAKFLISIFIGAVWDEKKMTVKVL